MIQRVKVDSAENISSRYGVNIGTTFTIYNTDGTRLVFLRQMWAYCDNVYTLDNCNYKHDNNVYNLDGYYFPCDCVIMAASKYATGEDDK